MLISIKSEELNSEVIQLKKIACRIESNKNSLSGISNYLDYDIKCRQNIYHELNILYKELDNIELQLYKFCDFLTETSEAYLEAESRLQSHTFRDSIEFNNYTKPPALPGEKEESFFTRIGNKLKSGIKHLVDFFTNSNEKINNSYNNEELLTWDEMDNTKNSVFDYLERSGEQIVMGNYTDEVTLLGTGGQIGLGILGLDAPMDVRDIICDFHKWEWSWGHVGQTALDLIGLIPIVGAFKYADEVGTLAKGVSKSSDVIKNIDKADEIVDGIKGSENAIAMSVKIIGKGDNLAKVADAIKPIDGYTDIIVHGTEDAFWILRNGDWVSFDQRSMANYIKNLNGYNGGPIRLISCNTGGKAKGVAQNLANKLGVKIMAPSDTLWIYGNGTMTIGDSASSNTGIWKTFLPGNK